MDGVLGEYPRKDEEEGGMRKEERREGPSPEDRRKERRGDSGSRIAERAIEP